MAYREFMKLDDQFSIEIDAFSFCLKQTTMQTKTWRRTGQTITKEYDERYWFPTLEMCFRRYIQETSITTPDMETLFTKLDNLEELLTNFSSVYVIEERPTKLYAREDGF